jgi:membrane protease YdiL (CAAX protease family)
MKKCPYCGNEYPDDATNCAIDNELLLDNSPQLVTAEKKEAEAAPKKEEPYIVFPDYKWSARDAWKCVGMILVFGFLWDLIVVGMDWHFLGFYNWRESNPFGRCLMAIIYYAIGLLTAAYFARTETLENFWKGFGLNCKPSNYVWFGVVMALAIRFFGHFILIHGWSKGVSTYEIKLFEQTFGSERFFLLFPLVLFAPLFEESINRGFLYKAFRGSYPIGISTTLIIAWTAFNHWPQYSHSWIAALDLSALTIVQCYLREKSASLWDCIICHFTFNVSLLFVSGK